MKIHEYQGKEIFRKSGIPVPEGIVACTADEAFAAAQRLAGTVVVKSQIHAGGRGKGRIYKKADVGVQHAVPVLDRGVAVVKTPDEAKKIASQILGNVLVTHQTGAKGKEVKRLLVEKGCNIKKEYYLGLVLDRATSRVTLMASREGGMDIEEVATKHPAKILKETIDPAFGFQTFQGRKLGFALGLDKDAVGKFVRFCDLLCTAYTITDASIIEINPLVLTVEGELLALDAKINFDDNALYRHPDLAELRDLSEEDEQEIAASKHDLSFIALDGNIGCMVNGAGLAMATLDIIKSFGGEPANFLDVGGGASKEKVTAAFKIILKDPKVKAILVNIFGGIMKCDVIADGVVAAAKEIGLSIPLVVRLQGTNVDLGKKILAESGLKIILADTMDEAARLVVECVV